MDLEELKNLAKELPAHQPSADRSELLRTTLLASVENEPVRPPLRASWKTLGAVAAAAALAFYVGQLQGRDTRSTATQPSSVPALAQLSSSDGASFEHRVRPAVDATRKSVEEVRLTLGSLHIDIDEADHRELQIYTRDALVRGLAQGGRMNAVFDVVTNDGGIQAVLVTKGRVEIRIENQPPVVLGPGESWAPVAKEIIELASRDPLATETETALTTETETAQVTETEAEAKLEAETAVAQPRAVAEPKTVAVAAAEQKPVAKPKALTEPKPRVVAEPEPTTELATQTRPAPPPTRRAATAAELAFDAGYRAVKRGDFSQALADLQSTIDSARDPALRVDARYWRIVALARLGKKKSSMQAMSEFLASHGGTSRAGEVATMLAWLHFDDGEHALATPLFHLGERDSSPRVRRSAKAGLKAIAAAKP